MEASWAWIEGSKPHPFSGAPVDPVLFRRPREIRAAGKKGLLWLDRELGFFPLIPAALQYEDLVVTTGYKLPRHPGTGLFVGSGAIENEGFVFGIFVEPTLNIL